MEVYSSFKKKYLPKRKKAMVERSKKKLKRPSRKEKKQSKNMDKKTRSGCTYSPYDMQLDKSDSTAANSSIKNQSLSSNDNIKLVEIRNVEMNDSDKGTVLENGSNLNENGAQDYQQNDKDIVENLSQQATINDIDEIKPKTKKVASNKRGKRKGRKSRLIAKQIVKEAEVKVDEDDCEERPSTRSKWPSSWSQRLNTMNTSCSNATDPICRPDDDINVTTDDHHNNIDDNLVDKQTNAQTQGSNEANTKKTVNLALETLITDETDKEIWESNAISNLNLLDMVFPDSDLCHSISEKEFGSCREFGCKPIGRFNYTNEDQGLRQFAACSSKCMLTDTEKYVFKSCFKDIQSQIENFDRYRGAETPGGEASLYDVNESSPVDTRKLYRKNFTDLKLNMWYNYVYHSAQLARDAGANSFANCGLTNSLPNFHKLIADNFLLKYLTAEELILKFTQFIDVRLQDDVVPAGSLPDQKHGIYFHIEKASSP